jgi:hypothetical protein
MAEFEQKWVVEENCIRYTSHQKNAPPAFGKIGKDIGGIPFSFYIEPIIAPTNMVIETYVHDFPDYLGFYGSNPLDIREFDAEIWLFLGAEREKVVVTKPTYIVLPPGTMHGPILFRRIDKPIYFFHAYDRPAYRKQVVPSNVHELVPDL